MLSLRDRKSERRKKRLVIMLCILFVLFILYFSGFFKFLARGLHFIGVPLWKTENTITSGIVGDESVFLTRSSLQKRNEELKMINEELNNRMMDYSVIKKENDELKELLGRVPKKNDYILGVVLSKPSRSIYDTIIIDIGTNDGVSESMEVFALGNIPIGYVKKAYNNSSTVELYSSPGETLEAQIEGTNASTILTGRGGGNFEMSIPKDLNITTGNTLVLPRISANVVAIVANVVSDGHDPLQKVILRSPINIEELKWIQVKK